MRFSVVGIGRCGGSKCCEESADSELDGIALRYVHCVF